jgi:hypothetical protein
MHEEEDKLFRKANNKHTTKQAALWTKKQKENMHMEHDRLKVKRSREKERKDAERAELQCKKQEAKEARAFQKAVQLSQRDKRPVLQKTGSMAKKMCIAHTAKGSGRGSKPASVLPPKRTRTPSVNLPA